MPVNLRQRTLKTFLTVTCALLLWTSTVHGAASGEEVILQLHWKHQFEFAGYYAAQHKGFFAEEGLNVQIKELSDQGSTVEEVLDGAAHYGTSPSGLILEHMQGRPLVLLANDLKSSPLVLLTSTDYTDITQLKGKKVMGARFEPQHAEIVYMLKANGIEIDDLEWIQHSFNTEDIINGQAAAMTAYLSNQPYQLTRQNIPYTVFSPKKYGFDFYGNCLFTSQAEAHDNPERTKKIMRASKKGWEYAVSHPEEIIAHIIATYPVLKTRDALRFEATEISKLVDSGNCPIGSIDPQKVENIASMFTALGLADTEPDLTGFISPEAELCRMDEVVAQPLEPQEFLQLSIDEQDYLARNQPLTACMIRDWPPYEMVDNQGNVTGIAADFAQMVEKSIGKGITPVLTKNWEESQEYARDRQCDMILLLNKTSEREEYLTFTEPVYQTHFVIIGRSDQGYRGSLDELSGKTLTLFKGHGAIETIRQQYPSISLILVDSLREALQKVHSGEADATLCALASFVSSVTMMGLPDLEVVGETDLSFEFSVGVRNDDPVLASIMGKMVDSLDPAEVTKTINRWFSVRVEKQFDYTLFWKIFAGIFVLAGLLLYRHLLLARHHVALQKAHKDTLLEKERAEKALHAEQNAIQKNLRFVDMISHEYRTPVSVISANLEIMQLKTLESSSEFSGNLNKMQQATVKLIEIIETALNRDRLEDGKLVAHKELFKLTELITETLEETQSNYPDRSISLDNTLTGVTHMNGDAALIKVVLRNLLENALKYSPAAEPVVLSLSKDTMKNVFTMTVTDRGRGIPEHEHDQIFEKFHRATNTTDVPGAGIGLHMVKTIIDQHDGHISITSPEEGGTTITIFLPDTP